ncbi:formyl transferase [Colletotrichum tabaci]|uniref:methionyl-tRNA formyltransferase n=1 Tax=Colletotrichum tabaci TaxID=1209068 RepID=A0AAV9TD11_9PEZI
MTWLALRPAAFARAPPFGLTCRPGLRSYSAAAAAAGVPDPLRILFCGSDDFSCAALDALDAERRRNPGLIESLDVVVRPGKLSGRGMKKIREVPLKSLAEKLELPIHERDTFTGWQPPKGINLIVAVSFGLFVPPRLLNQAKYGGLNLHPSFLPDFRGPAPLQHTLLQRRTHTGVTLQTLHPKSFDHGAVVSYTPPIPIPENCTTRNLHDLVTPLAAETLVDSLQRGLHVPPVNDIGWRPTPEELARQPLTHAPKVTSHDRQMDWRSWSADEVLLRRRVLGPVWCAAFHHDSQTVKRVQFGDAEVVEPPHLMKQYQQRCALRRENKLASDDFPDEVRDVRMVSWVWMPRGKTEEPESWEPSFTPYFLDEDGKSILIATPGGEGCLKLSTVTVEGGRPRAAAAVVGDFSEVVKDEDDGHGPGQKGGDWLSWVVTAIVALILGG